MLVLASIRNNKSLILVTSLICLIVIFIASILFLDKSSTPSSSPTVSGKFIGYDDTEKTILSLSSDPVLKENRHYRNMVDDIKKLRNKIRAVNIAIFFIK